MQSVSLILAGLKAIIAQIAFKRRDRTEFLVVVHGRICRTLQRFEQLYARWCNGTLPKQRGPRPARAAGAPRTPRIRLPSGRAWLLRELQHYEANGRASQLRYLLANAPDLPEFLAAAPQAARLLRPLCQMLGVKFSPPAKAAAPTPPPPAPQPSPAAECPTHPTTAPSPHFSTA